MSFKLTKEHEGKKLWCVPTQNNVSRGGGDALGQAKLKVVSNVKRVYVELDGQKHSLSDYGAGEDYAVYSTKYNSGWIVFDCENSLLAYKMLMEDTTLIRKTLVRVYGELPLSASQIRSIANIIRGDSL